MGLSESEQRRSLLIVEDTTRDLVYCKSLEIKIKSSPVLRRKKSKFGINAFTKAFMKLSEIGVKAVY